MQVFLEDDTSSRLERLPALQVLTWQVEAGRIRVSVLHTLHPDARVHVILTSDHESDPAAEFLFPTDYSGKAFAWTQSKTPRTIWVITGLRMRGNSQRKQQ